MRSYVSLVSRTSSCDRDPERMVLWRAVRWHLDRRILCNGNKAAVLD